MFTNEEQRIIDRLLAADNFDSSLKQLTAKAESLLAEMKKQEQQVNQILNQKTADIQSHAADINKIVQEKTQGFPWLADAFAQYRELCDLETSKNLENKKHPARTAAEEVRAIAKEKRILQKEARISRNLVRYYEALFPWLQDFVGQDIDDLIEQVRKSDTKENQEAEDDPVREYLTQAEYEKLPTSERNQRALDRYWAKKKSSWELGRDYERYIGYQYERTGYNVAYQGIEAGLEDLGRDLIVHKNGQTKVVQCKYWASHKTIHEKHICQLFGTTLKYWLENKKEMSSNKQNQLQFWDGSVLANAVNGVFITSTTLSPTAREFAQELRIEVQEKIPFDQKYPSVKCNVARVTKEKIYHLPFDQQYDKTKVDEQNECYVKTVAEAEQLGFRRAYRWRGNKAQ